MYLSSFTHLRESRYRRILALAGYDVRIGIPQKTDQVAVWGAGKTADRGKWLAGLNGAKLLHLEDGFLRSVKPGRTGEAPLSLLVDTRAPYFESSVETDLEHLLQYQLDATADKLDRANQLIELLKCSGVSKYNTATGQTPEPGFVLVADQTHGDRAIAGAQASAQSFSKMLDAARAEHSGRRIIIHRHPETMMGLRPGHYDHISKPGVEALGDAVAPYSLLSAAHAVYTVSSQIGFEAILAGHKPVVFGQAFYSGWGLTDDRAAPIKRRTRQLSTAELVLGAMIEYPVWYDPYHDKLTGPESVVAALEAQARAYREDKQGAIALGMRLWKRQSMSRFFQNGALRFADSQEQAQQLATSSRKPILEWSGRGSRPSKETPEVIGVEDGFIRSSGLGAELVPALSLVRDSDGIYFDPSTASTLERIIGRTGGLTSRDLMRAKRLRARLQTNRVTKYNLEGETPPPTTATQRRILVVGQVEDDASILFGAVGQIRTNQSLFEAAQAAHPNSRIIFKPHPDVEAGLRPGGIPSGAEHVAKRADPVSLIELADEVWTITSLLGFEALIRGKHVVTCGLPFYAGWGLTEDLAPKDHPAFARRSAAQISVDGLVHAALIAYPRYHDPISDLACPVEVILDRLETGTPLRRSSALKTLSKVQGLAASYNYLWR